MLQKTTDTSNQDPKQNPQYNVMIRLICSMEDNMTGDWGNTQELKKKKGEGPSLEATE